MLQKLQSLLYNYSSTSKNKVRRLQVGVQVLENGIPVPLSTSTKYYILNQLHSINRQSTFVNQKK